MISTVILLLLLLCNVCDSIPLVFNKREQLESDPLMSHETAATLTRWFKVRRAGEEELTQVVIAIKHRSSQRLEELFWSVSDPSSPTYGQFLQQDELSELVSPTQRSVSMVTSWLERNGVNFKDSCTFSPLRDFLLCELSVGK